MSSPNPTRLVQLDSTGLETKVYALTTGSDRAQGKERLVTRLDIVSRNAQPPSMLSVGISKAILASPRTLLWEYVMPLFLPHGYPNTVTADYTPYQIYDSLQAFASTIAGLLSSRAVLQSLGLDDKAAGSATTATYATLISIARSTIANLSTILFAHHASQRIGRQVKFYRFFADIVNDLALLIDCLSPSLPPHFRVPALCLSSASRAICGVAGGSSKAILSAHFSANGNIGELNAKDGSQETVINLLGMWIGGFVVSRVSSVSSTWCWMVGLLGLHLWFNYCAVRSVRLRYMNNYRASKVLGELCRTNTCPTVDQIGKTEAVFGRSGLLLDGQHRSIGRIRSGLDVSQFIRVLGGSVKVGSGTMVVEQEILHALLSIFQDEQFLIWFRTESQTAYLMLKETATAEDQLKAWCQCIRICTATAPSGHLSASETLKHISSALHENCSQWQAKLDKIKAAGWNVDLSSIETMPGCRFKVRYSQSSLTSPRTF